MFIFCMKVLFTDIQIEKRTIFQQTEIIKDQIIEKNQLVCTPMCILRILAKYKFIDILNSAEFYS